MREQATISQIYRLGECEAERDPMESWGRIEMQRRRAWQEGGVIAVKATELPPDLGAQLTAWAEVQYGKRKA